MAWVLPFIALWACASLPEASRRVGDATHTYALAGADGPVVVFESGLGDGRDSWSGVFEPVSGFARAFAYDRAGYGGSHSSAALRDGATVVAELRRLLRALDLAPPYLLVGHSLGGHFVELFAREHPEEVAGVVFVDARHVDFSQRCVAQEVERCGVPWFVRWLMPAGARAELAASARTEAQLRAAAPFPPIPVRVLSAGQRPASMPNLRREWARAQADLARLSPRGSQETCDACGHYVQRDDPERVVRTIQEGVEELRSSAQVYRGGL
ncbi:MAG: alpha/beta fold hydrolase [Myxococcota bacterium]